MRVPFGGKKKGADGGIDGIIYFKPDGKRTEKALVSVKGGDNVGGDDDPRPAQREPRKRDAVAALHPKTAASSVRKTA